MPLEAFESLPDNPNNPAVPLQASVDSSGNVTFKNSPAILPKNRLNLDRLRAMQYAVHRKAFDANGIMGAQGDYWYALNAPFDKAINFVYFSSWNIVSVFGDEITLTPVDSGADTRLVLDATYRQRETILNQYWINGFARYAAVSPNDMLEFQYPSAAYNKLKAKVLQVIDCSDTEITLKLDKNVSIAETVQLYHPETETEPDNLSVKIYTYGRMAEQWDYLLNPNYFYGSKREKTIAAEALPSNKIWVFEETAIASPESFDELDGPNFKIQGFNGSTWTSINENAQRLHIKADGAAYAIGTTLPAGSIRTTPSSDLTATYSQFRVLYYKETDSADESCSIRGFYCFNSREDLSKSVGNYGTTDGVAVEDGKHYFCNERVFEEFEYIDDFNKGTNSAGPDGIPDRVNTTLAFADGIGNYRPKCMQFGYCSLFDEVISKLDHAEAPFTMDYKTGPVLKNLVFAADCQRKEKFMLASFYGTVNGYDALRIKHPSIAYLNGYYANLETADGWHIKQDWRGQGSWAFPLQVTDPDTDNVYLVPKHGFERENNGMHWLIDDYDFTTKAYFPNLGAAYRNKRNPLEHGATVADDLLELLGVAIERDSGAIVAERGISGNSLAIAPQDITLTVNLAAGITQETYQASFIKVMDQDAILTIKPLRQPLKSEKGIGSRTIASASYDSGKDAWKIQFNNEYKTWSELSLGDLGTFGDSYDKLYQVSCSGGPVIRPYEHQSINSYHTEDKGTGSRHAGLAAGDCMAIGENRFLVIDVQPSAGDAAANWGNRQVIRKGDTYGFWQANMAEPDEQLPLSITSVINNTDSGVAMLFVDNAEDKPELADNEYWFDGVSRIYFSSANDGDFITINAKDGSEDELTFTGYHTVEKNQDIIFDLEYSEWTGATTKQVFIGGESMTVTASTAPAAGQVYGFDNGSGKLKLRFNIDNAGNNKDIKIVLSYPVDADEPANNWTFDNNFLAYGKNYDVCYVKDDTGYFEDNAATGETAEFYQSSTVFVPQNNLIVQYKEASGDWVTIGSEHLTTCAAAGTITIAKDFFTPWRAVPELDALEGTIQIRAKDVCLFDHRGWLPASILNKVEYMNANQQWCFTSLGGGVPVDISHGESAFIEFDLKARNPSTIPFDGCWLPDYTTVSGSSSGFSGNGVTIIKGNNGPGGRATENSAYVGYSILNSFGIPVLLQNLPDGCVIEQALMEVTTTGLTRDYGYIKTAVTDCNGNEISPYISISNSDVIDISYSVIGLSSKTSFESIGTIAGAANGRRVIDATSIIQTMYDNRNTNQFLYGYGIIFVPNGTGNGSIADIVPQSPPALATVDGPCFPCGQTSYFHETEQIYINWGGASIGQIAVKVTYPESLMQSQFVQPNLPPMINVLPAA